MLYIAICDDDEYLCGWLENLLQSLMVQKEETNIEVFFSAEECLKFIYTQHSFDMIFLDIELHNENGIQLGTIIRERIGDLLMQIVYISAKDTYSMQLFDTQPLNFLVKPIEVKKVKRVLDKGLKILNTGKKIFYYKKGHNVRKEYIDNIFYFEGCGREVIIHTVTGKEIFYGKLTDIFNEVVHYNFFFCHKSYLVNYNNIKVWQRCVLVMINGDVLPISQSKRKEVSAFQLRIEERA